MKTIRHIVLLLCVVSATALSAQDTQRLSEQELTGTARYVGMGGAMTAIGGDPSAVKDNPAGLGLYRRMEVMISFDERYDRTHQAGADWKKNNYFVAPQASWVFAFGDPYKERGVIYNNFMFSYSRLRTFNRSFAATATGQTTSLADVICLNTNGLQEKALQPAGRWNDVNVGWLSCQGYDTYLINPTEVGGNQWTTVLLEGETLSNSLRIREYGYANQYGLDWGMNISNRVYLGAGIRMLSFSYSQTAVYSEKFGGGGDLLNKTDLTMSGIGVNGAFGIIYRPVECLRLGASIQTPTASTLSVGNSGTLSATTDSLRTSGTPTNSTSVSGFRMPLRSSVSMAFQIKQYGLLSFQYDYLHQKNMNDVHSLRAGLEIVPINNLFINAGYVYESSFRKQEDIVKHAYDAVRTDTYFQNIRRTQYISLGVGYRGKVFVAQAAYQLGLQGINLYAHQLATPYDMRTQTHRVVFTLAWHTRD